MTWLQIATFRVNSFLLMVILLWIQVGFAMVLLSAAIKGVPTETLEAARLDGAGEGRSSSGSSSRRSARTLITVFITVLIGVLKTFDIVYVMTNGNFNTNVIAVDFFNQLFTNRNNGYAAAIVVMLLIVDDPDPGLPGSSVPCRGGRPMSGTQAVTATPVQLPKQPADTRQARQGRTTRPTRRRSGSSWSSWS